MEGLVTHSMLCVHMLTLSMMYSISFYMCIFLMLLLLLYLNLVTNIFDVVRFTLLPHNPLLKIMLSTTLNSTGCVSNNHHENVMDLPELHLLLVLLLALIQIVVTSECAGGVVATSLRIDEGGSMGPWDGRPRFHHSS